MDFFSMEHEVDEHFFHDDKGDYNYTTVPGERWNCSKIFLYDGRGYIKDGLSACGERLYLKCRKNQRKPHPCKGRAIITRKCKSLR
jgi:hypothetical protein